MFRAPAAGVFLEYGANSKGNFIGSVFIRYNPCLMK